MAMESVFSDQVVNASELRRNQRQWLEEALKRPVTVNFSRRQLAIMNREQARDLFIRVQFAELALTACRDIEKGSVLEKLPWLENLTLKERRQFRDELLSSFLKSSKTGDWDDIDDLISDWKATADAKGSPEIVEALKEANTTSEYVTLD